MLDGMITVYKEAGFTSNDVVAKLRGILRQKKIGHTGTLDPDAEGVLPVCLGKGTKLCELIADRDKEYEAVLRLGVVTDTQDISGAVLSRLPDEAVRERVTGTALRAAAAGFVGDYDQIPPMYSALKVGGKKLYELARAGQTVERAPRRVHIYELEIGRVALPLVTMRVRCSKGTYIRTLCHDLGEKLGVGGTMESLLRTRVGDFTLSEAKKLSELEAMVRGESAQADSSQAGALQAENAGAGCAQAGEAQVGEAQAGALHAEQKRSAQAGESHAEQKRSTQTIQALVRPIESFFKDAPRGVVRPEALPYLQNGNPLRPGQVQFTAGEAFAPILHNGERVRVCEPDGAFRALYRYDAAKKMLTVEKMF